MLSFWLCSLVSLGSQADASLLKNVKDQNGTYELAVAYAVTIYYTVWVSEYNAKANFGCLGKSVLSSLYTDKVNMEMQNEMLWALTWCRSLS